MIEDQYGLDFLRCYSLMLTCLGAAYISAITFIPLSATGNHYADIVLGFLLGTALTTIISYWFGSSAQSRSKDTTIASLSTPPTP